MDMEKLIRIADDQQDRQAPLNKVPSNKTPSKWLLPSLGIVLFSVIAVAASGTAAWHGKGWGLPAFILLVGVAVVSIIFVLSLLMNWGRDGAEKEAAQNVGTLSQSLKSSFLASRSPSLIVKDGRPVLANAAYLDLAESLGIMSAIDEPPAIDLLFSKNKKEVAAAIFRLHHTSKESGVGTETIRTMTDAGVRVFNVVVTPLDEGQLWEVDDLAEEGIGHASLLAEAPIGLFSVHEDGRVLEMNGVLRRWLGFSGEDIPELMREFIKDPEILLESPKTAGRIVRSDTQLITKKGVNSPTVMSGGWHTLETGGMYASVAVYGHSGLGARSTLGAQMSMSAPSSALQESAQAAGVDVLGEAPFSIVQLDCADLAKAKVLGANAAFTQMTGQHVPAGDAGQLSFKTLFAQNAETQAFIEGGVDMVDGPVDVYLINGDGHPVNVYFSQSYDGSPIG